MAFLSQQDIKRFWSHVDIKSVDVCWPFFQAKDSHDYGVFWLSGKSYGAHRIAYEIQNGPIATGMIICHTCDNPSCCNPGHLFIGTVKDNSDDKIKKGRMVMPKGEQHYRCRLTDIDVQQIRLAYLTDNITQDELACRYGINQSTVSRIVKGIRRV